MASIFVDTSAWWAFFDDGDQGHAEAERTMRVLIESRADLITSRDVFDEVVTGLLGRAGHHAAVKAGRGILESPSVVMESMDDDIFRDAWAVFRKRDRMGWSLTDCTSFAVMKRRSIRKAFSFDVHFKRMGVEVIP